MFSYSAKKCAALAQRGFSKSGRNNNGISNSNATRPTTTSRSLQGLFCQQRASFSTASSSDQKIPFYGLPRPPVKDDTNSNWKQRLVVALRSASTAFRDPTRDDAVAALGEVTGSLALQRILEQMRQHSEGRDILRDRPLVDKDHIPHNDLMEQAKQQQQQHSNGDQTNITFGQAYGRFLLSHDFDPNERKPVQHISDPDLAYVMLRYRQCHDYWHTLTGLPPTVLGELGLKWLELFQTGMPIAALSCTVGTLGLSPNEQRILWQVYLPWAIRVHHQQQEAAAADHLQAGSSLMTVYYEREFDTPLAELRDRLKLEPAPDTTGEQEDS